MAVNDDMRDDNPERDPKLAQWLAAASREEPPAVLDAAILAAARREVGARPQVVGSDAGGGGGGGEAGAPPVRAKRNWYVPVSIAAVMVLSVSLVSVVQHEKGDELAQPPRSAGAPAKIPAPAAVTPAAPAVPAAAPTTPKADDRLRDAMPSPKLADKNRADSPAATRAAAAPDGYTELAKKQRMEKAETAASGATVGVARKDHAAALMREQQGPRGETSANISASKSAPGAVAGGLAAPATIPAPQDRASVEARRETEASGRGTAQERARGTAGALGTRGLDSAVGSASGGAGAPAAAEPALPPREAKASPEPFPAQASRDAARATIPEAPVISVVPVAPSAPAAAAPRRSPSVDDGVTRSAPAMAEGRVMASPPPAPKPAARLAQQRLLLWRGLEDQPPEKWLERLAQFKRDNRQADADELLAEFRRRFPDHPASVR